MSAPTLTPAARPGDGPDRPDAARLDALHGYRVLDQPAEDELHDVVRAAAAVALVPFATLNLIDEHRQCQLTAVGFQGRDSARRDSMCALHFADGELVVVADASLDARYVDNPWVDGRLGAVRFYASAPLVTPDGHALGSLCVFDHVPGALAPAGVEALRGLARVVVSLFERRRQARLAAEHAAEAARQRALAQRATADAEARQELADAVLEAVDVGIVVAGPDGRLARFNRAARRWHGLDADAGLDPADHAATYDLRAPDGRTSLSPEQVPLHRVVRGEDVDGDEIVIARRGHAPRSVVCSGRTMTRADGTPLGAVAAMSDITALRTRELALERANRELEERTGQLTHAVADLERSNAELAQFAGIAGHDLSSPLTVVSGYLEMLADTYGDGLDEQARDWIGTARRGAERMKDLIGSLLVYAQAGASTCRRERLDVQEVLDHAVLDLRTAVRAAGARVGAGPLPVLHGDPVLLRQLLQNLIGNAIKYRHPERPCRVELSCTRGEDGWTFAVADNGIGIPPEHRERVFAVFAQVEPEARDGHGIGLATCQRIVERHGGRIRVEGNESGGTTVVFTVPQRSVDHRSGPS